MVDAASETTKTRARKTYLALAYPYLPTPNTPTKEAVIGVTRHSASLKSELIFFFFRTDQ
jgi:hypothetical protein